MRRTKGIEMPSGEKFDVLTRLAGLHCLNVSPLSIIAFSLFEGQVAYPYSTGRKWEEGG